MKLLNDLQGTMNNFEAIKYYDQNEMKDFLKEESSEVSFNKNFTRQKLSGIIYVSITLLFISTSLFTSKKNMKSIDFNDVFIFDDLSDSFDERFSIAIIEDLKKGL